MAKIYKPLCFLVLFGAFHLSLHAQGNQTTEIKGWFIEKPSPSRMLVFESESAADDSNGWIKAMVITDLKEEPGFRIKDELSIPVPSRYEKPQLIGDSLFVPQLWGNCSWIDKWDLKTKKKAEVFSCQARQGVEWIDAFASSPDQKHLAVSVHSYVSEYFALLLADEKRGVRELLKKNWGGEEGVASTIVWNPDGKGLFYCTPLGDLVHVKLDDGQIQKVDTGVGPPQAKCLIRSPILSFFLGRLYYVKDTRLFSCDATGRKANVIWQGGAPILAIVPDKNAIFVITASEARTINPTNLESAPAYSSRGGSLRYYDGLWAIESLCVGTDSTADRVVIRRIIERTIAR